MINHNEKEIIHFSVLGKNRKTGEITLSVRKEAGLLESLRKDTCSARIEKLRKKLILFKNDAEQIQLQKECLPKICAGCKLQRTSDSVKIKDYNGIVTLNVHLKADLVPLVKEQLTLLPQTRAVFIGYDGESLVILLRFKRPDGTLPTKGLDIKHFHATAFQLARQYISPYLPAGTESPKEILPEATFLQTLDSKLFYNPDAVPILIRQSHEITTIVPRSANTGSEKLRSNMMEQHQFIQQHYDIRYNMIKETLEYRCRNKKENSFRQLDTIEQNSISLDMLQAGIQIWDRDTRRYLYSNRIEKYNPITDYLNNTGKWDGQHRIKMLSDCVKCDNPHWALLFRRWFLCMVANWKEEPAYANCTSPLLIGKQGFRKSTFCRILLPPELRFGFTDRLDLENKRTAEMYLSRFLLINLDEFDQIGVRHQAFLKHLLQKASSSIRKPYSPVISETRRYASFIGTSNVRQLLYDTSGSRRFLCIEVKEKIDIPADIDYRQLYAEALHAIDKGERFWFNREEEALLQKGNRLFEADYKYGQLFWARYRRPEHPGEGIFLSCTQLLQSICQPQEFSKLSNGHIAAFGRQIQKWQLEKKHSEAGTLYKVVEIR